MPVMKLKIPTYAAAVISALEENGYEAFAVGGCVRDTLLGREPEDWDITTNARPDEIRRLFSFLYGFSAIPTGIAHGTVTVLSEGKPVEVTTYRIDGEYSDHRRPDSVEFCYRLKDDLARRDFTVNAMAYSETEGLIDPFGGQEDLKNGIIRCVGDPKRRFSEDALRIIRAVRFASVLGFKVEEKTAEAALDMRGELAFVSRERVSAEFSKLICGKKAAAVLAKFWEVAEEIFPRIVCHDPRKTVDSIKKLKDEPLAVMLSAVLWDTEVVDAKAMLRGLRFDKKTCTRVAVILENRNFSGETKTDIKKLCRKIGTEAAEDLLKLLCARLQQDSRLIDYLWEIRKNGECVSVSSLAVNGKDVLPFGVDGANVGKILDYILDKVVEGELENNRDVLMPAIEKYIYCMEKNNERGTSL